MGHRALVAYQQDGDSYDVYYSHWGAMKLCLRFPLAEGMEPGDTTAIDQRLPTDGSRQVGIDPEAQAEGVPIEAIVEDVLDYMSHEALYVVPQIGEVEAFLTLDFRFHADEPNGGALVSPRWYQGEPLGRHVTPRFRGWKDVYEELIDEDILTVEDAKERLSGRVWTEWGKASAVETSVPGYSPRGTTPRGLGDSINVSRRMAARDQREQNR